jgi:alpha-1,6-mannosyltransferase
VTLSPVRRLCALGITMFVALVVCARGPSGTAGPFFLIPLGIAGVAYLLSVREFFLTQQYPRHIIFACLALSGVWRVPFLLKPATSQDDLRRYVWDGRLQHLGYNPYIAIPNDPKLAAVHTTETRGMNNPDVPSPYPAGAQLFFRGVTSISESTFAFKVAFMGCDWAMVLVLLNVLRRTNVKEHWVLAYWWHPLLATDVAGSGHVDIVGALLLLISFAAIIRRWRTTAAIAFGLAVATKFLPIVLLPLYWRRVRMRDALIAVLVFTALYAPFLVRWRVPLGSLGIFVQRFRFNDPIFAAVERVANPVVAAAFAVLAGLAVAAWIRIRCRKETPDAWAWPMGAALVCAPVIYPWYLIWLLPFLRSASSAPLILWSVTILSTYFVWHLHAIGGLWRVPGWIAVLEYLPVLAAAFFVLVRVGQASSAPTENGN